MTKLLCLLLMVSIFGCNGIGTELNPLNTSDPSRSDSQAPLPEVIIENEAPLISSLETIFITEDEDWIEVAFTIFDDRTLYNCSDSLEVTSLNSTLIPSDNLSLSGRNGECLLSFKTAENKNGFAQIYLAFNDGTQVTGNFLSVYVTSMNDAPEISAVEDQIYVFDSSETGHTVSFTIQDVDSSILCSENYLLVESSDLSILTKHQIDIETVSPGNCRLRLYPKKPGEVSLKIYLDDGPDFVVEEFKFLVKQSEVASLIGNTGATLLHQGVTQDLDFNTYVTGYKDEEVDGLPQFGSYDGYLVKYNQNFEKIWGLHWGSFGGSVYAKKVVSTPSGYLYVVGDTDVSFFGVNKTGVRDGFIIKFDQDGRRIWTKFFGASSSEIIVNNLVIDKNENAFIVGVATDGIGTEEKIGDYDTFILKFNKNGSQKMLRLFGESAAQVLSYDLALDSEESIYIAGSTNADLHGVTKAGTQDGFVVKYSKYGDRLQTTLYGVSSSNTTIRSLEISPTNEIFFMGETTGGLEGNSLTGTQDIFVAKSYRSGELLWLNQLGAAGSMSWAAGLELDEEDNIYLLGRTAGDFEGNTLNGIWDLFVTKYSSGGEKIETIMKGESGGYMVPVQGVVNNLGNVIVVGTSNKGIDGEDEIGEGDGFLTSSFIFGE